MPSASEMARLRADPERWAQYIIRRNASMDRYRSKKRSAKAASAMIAAEDIRAERLEVVSRAPIDQMAVYQRALALFPRSIPLEIRRSYAADALLAVIDGTIPLDFTYADLHPLRLVDLPMDWSGQFILIGAVTEDDKGMLSGLY